ncbi:hypothetical protein LR48_Vigan03g233900 [Vigna angularis]|uniref:Uncharacterized protein n=1 Tax=Phaseolus angularis TaxID=3914 RepID=A0A0L9U8G4_PHAAN|nr:hypothetical protein LR48_Vigan03g233900 [Vigna angularis]
MRRVFGSLGTTRDYRTRSNWLPLIFQTGLPSIRRKSTQKTRCPAFDYLENSLGKFDDGPFFLGQFSWVVIAYVPFVERFQLFLFELFKHDITEGRPKLASWIENVSDLSHAFDNGASRPTASNLLVTEDIFICENMFLVQEVNKINVYTQTRGDPKDILDLFKKRLLVSKQHSHSSQD